MICCMLPPRSAVVAAPAEALVTICLTRAVVPSAGNAAPAAPPIFPPTYPAAAFKAMSSIFPPREALTAAWLIATAVAVENPAPEGPSAYVNATVSIVGIGSLIMLSIFLMVVSITFPTESTSLSTAFAGLHIYSPPVNLFAIIIFAYWLYIHWIPNPLN